ncbi:N-acetyltransferase [soil metagenome]
MKCTITIRPEKYKDFNAIAAVHTLAFGRPGEANLIELLRDSNTFMPEMSLVAVKDGAIVGHILFSKIIIRRVKNTPLEVLALAPMAVLPSLQQQGIGIQLVEEGIKRARLYSYPGVIVLGHEHYYPKFGFQPASRWGIICPYETEDENWLALELKPNGLATASGLVQYPKEFDSVE